MATKKQVLLTLECAINSLQDIKRDVLNKTIPPSFYDELIKELE